MYQTMIPDNVASSSIRKSNHFKSSKEDQNSRIIPSSNNFGNCTFSTTSQHQNNTSSFQIDQTHIHENNPNPNLTQCLNSNGNNGDLLLQWGQRKRSRCSRMEPRSNHVTTPVPCKINGYRNGRVKPNGLFYAKDAPGLLPTKNRNLGDQMGCSSSGSPSRNGAVASGAISRSGVGKRSPSKGYGAIKRVKSDDSLPQNHTDFGGQINGNIGPSQMAVVEAEKGNGEVVECPRIYLSLSRKEKEEDFYAIKGTKLPHRPKKRPKAVDRALQYCYPGLWLSDLTRARYEVRERKSTKKSKRRGLKGLENMDSESE